MIAFSSATQCCYRLGAGGAGGAATLRVMMLACSRWFSRPTLRETSFVGLGPGLGAGPGAGDVGFFKMLAIDTSEVTICGRALEVPVAAWCYGSHWNSHEPVCCHFVDVAKAQDAAQALELVGYLGVWLP